MKNGDSGKFSEKHLIRFGIMVIGPRKGRKQEQGCSAHEPVGVILGLLLPPPPSILTGFMGDRQILTRAI